MQKKLKLSRKFFFPIQKGLHNNGHSICNKNRGLNICVHRIGVEPI